MSALLLPLLRFDFARSTSYAVCVPVLCAASFSFSHRRVAAHSGQSTRRWVVS